jgi:hypothetical protein
MTSHRTISLTMTLLAVLMAAAPSSAWANSLLSGYGGPGEGNQTILGSALLGGGSAGGGGSSSSTSGSTGSSSSGAAAPGGKITTPSGSSGAALGRAKRPTGGRSASRGGSGGASGGAARAYTAVYPSSASQPALGASETLGLSGEDLGYVLLAFGVLAFTGVVTRRLARTTRPGGL